MQFILIFWFTSFIGESVNDKLWWSFAISAVIQPISAFSAFTAYSAFTAFSAFATTNKA